MANHRLIHHPIAQGLLAIFILTTSCTDEVQQPRLEKPYQLSYGDSKHLDFFDQNERRAETRSTVSTFTVEQWNPILPAYTLCRQYSVSLLFRQRSGYPFYSCHLE